MDDPDVESQRVQELVLRCANQRASAAEREELVMYQQDHPELVQRALVRLNSVAKASPEQENEHWLARVQQEQGLQAQDSLSIQRTRNFMRTLVFMSFGLAFAVPSVSMLAVAIMPAMYLLFEFGVYFRKSRHDPYRKIQK